MCHDKGDERSKTCLGQYCNSSGSNYIIMEDLLVRVNMTELSLLDTKIPQTGDINAIFAELKADINGLDRKRGNDSNNSGVSGYSASLDK